MKLIKFYKKWEVESKWLKLYQNNNVDKSEDGERIQSRPAPAWQTDPLY